MTASLRSLLAAALLGLCLSPNLSAAAPATPGVIAKPAASADSKAASADTAQPSIEEQALAFTSSQEQSKQDLAALKRQLADAPRLISEAQRELARLKSNPPVAVAQRYAKSPLPDLEKLLDERSTELGELQKSLAEANSLIITSQTRPERAQAEISANQTRIQQINGLLKSGKDAGKAISDEQRGLLVAEQSALTGFLATASLWQDDLETETARPLAVYRKGHLAGKAAVVEHELGQGRAVYVGTRLDDDALEALVRHVLDRAGVRPVHAAPRGVEVTERQTLTSTYLFLLNHRQDKATVTLDRSGTDLITGRRLEAGQTLVLDAADVAVVRSPSATPQHAEPSSSDS